MFNLVRNAIEAMGNSARRVLTIRTTVNADDMVEISVADTGHGLAPDIRSRLFEPFVTSKPDGLGIGLSICRAIIEAHGGRLSADDNPGAGPYFALLFRVKPRASSLIPMSARPTFKGRSCGLSAAEFDFGRGRGFA